MTKGAPRVNILEQADQIVNHRSFEKERQYGDFRESMQKAATMASIMTGKEISERDMYLIMAALKLSRESFAHKQDNLLDCVAYLGALDNIYD